MQLLLQRQPSGILRVAAVHNVAEPRDPLRGLTAEPDRPNDLPINRCYLLAFAQISNDIGALLYADPVGQAATRTAVIEAKHEPRPLRGAPMDEGVDAQRPMRPDEASFNALHEGKVGPPHQGSIGENPEVLFNMSAIRVHGRQGRESHLWNACGLQRVLWQTCYGRLG